MIEIRFRGDIVGYIGDAIESDGTWSGSFEQSTPSVEARSLSRVTQYMVFCKDWNERVREGAKADAREFAEYDDVLQNGSWVAVMNGKSVDIEDGPNFFVDGVVSIRTKIRAH
jgi:hypothetical protein